MASQQIFETVYRSRQGFLHHASYMRMAKVLLTQYVLNKSGISLREKTFFDYGFGAGTFFRYCPSSTQLFGVEIDPVNVKEVTEMLLRRGVKNARLEPIEVEHWEQHPLLQKKYQVILCSHVLEHLAEPAVFLRRIKNCLEDDGVFIGLVPVNELRNNPHHVQTVDQPTIRAWMKTAGLKMRFYVEADPWTYWSQPLFTEHSAVRRILGQAVCLAIGLPATLLGYRLWQAISPVYARLTFSKPTQAAFVCSRG